MVGSQKSEVRSPKFGAGGLVAFTLIELLVSMAILVVIVLITAQLFTQATTVWNTGTARAEVNMKGRALADFMAQEISQAIMNADYPFTASGNTAKFWVLGNATTATRAAQKIEYYTSSATVFRKVTYSDGSSVNDEMCVAISTPPEFIPTAALASGTNQLPLYVDVKVTVSDQGSPPTNRVYESRACFYNRNRYRMD